MGKNVMFLGGDARVHALGWQMSLSSHVGDIFFVGGNAGTALVGTNVPLEPKDFRAQIDFAKKNDIDMTVVGPEDPICMGIADAFEEQSQRILAPSKAAAIERSKAEQALFVNEHDIPAPRSTICYDVEFARRHIRLFPTDLVVKADGLCGGKGVVVADTIEEADTALDNMMVKAIFGDAGRIVVLQERLYGLEFSVHALCSWSKERGVQYKLFPTSRDHKRLLDGNKGPNTGGMGGYAPDDRIKPDVMQAVEHEILIPTLNDLVQQGRPFVGLLYFTVIETAEGVHVIEYNVRFGAPECEMYMKLLRRDLYEALDSTIKGDLDNLTLRWSDNHAMCIVLAAPGYPGTPEVGDTIDINSNKFGSIPGASVFYAGAQMDRGRLVTSGGRVASVITTAQSLAEATRNCNAAADCFSLSGGKKFQRRRDIGFDVILAERI